MTMPDPIQLTRQGLVSAPERIPQMREEFRQTHCVRLPGLIEPALLGLWQRQVAASRFVPKTESHHGREFGQTLFMPTSESGWYVFEMIVNNPALFQLVRAITGCPEIGNFFGRIHRTLPAPEHRIEWHNDASDTRLVGLDINLSETPFEGGRFQLREVATQRNTFDVGSIPPGDGFLFSISPCVEHRLTPVEGTRVRTVAVGWFRGAPAWKEFASQFRLSRGSVGASPFTLHGASS